MNFTGLSEFLWFLLIFGALFAFTAWRQQRDRRRRQERMARLPDEPVPARPATVAAPVPRAAEATPDIAWGRGPTVPVPAPEIPPGWSDVPQRPESAPFPAAAPAVAGAARRTAPARPAVARRREAVHLRSAAGVRQAVVALTVFGPCRALEPYGSQWPQQAPGGDGPGRAGRRVQAP